MKLNRIEERFDERVSNRRVHNISNRRVHNILLLLRKIGLENGEYNWFMFFTRGGVRPILENIARRYDLV